MKIEPAGVERDRQIAELRGDKCVHFSALPIEFGGCAPACQKSCISFPDACCREGDEYCLAYMDKPYSTDIACAMELWAEMREAGAQPSLAVVQDFVACDAWLNYGDDNADLISNLGDDKTDKSTEAGAISECYVNWKVASNG